MLSPRRHPPGDLPVQVFEGRLRLGQAEELLQGHPPLVDRHAQPPARPSDRSVADPAVRRPGCAGPAYALLTDPSGPPHVSATVAAAREGPGRPRAVTPDALHIPVVQSSGLAAPTSIPVCPIATPRLPSGSVTTTFGDISEDEQEP